MGRLTIAGVQILSLAALAAAWEAAVRGRLLDPVFVPAPTAVVTAMALTAAEALPRLGDTLAKMLLAYALAAGLGITAGLALGARRLVYEIAMPYVMALYGVPKILVLPWIVLVFGVGVTAAVLSGALFAVFPIVVIVAAGVRDVDPVLIRVAVSMGAGRWQIARAVLLPAVVPSVVAGLRVGIVFALLGVLLAEMFAGIRGMGFFMQRLAMAFRAPELFAATALVSVLSIAVVLGLEHLDRRLGRWR
jgi:NitT/TauT family transport system permease protein